MNDGKMSWPLQDHGDTSKCVYEGYDHVRRWRIGSYVDPMDALESILQGLMQFDGSRAPRLLETGADQRDHRLIDRLPLARRHVRRRVRPLRRHVSR